ncbi:16S rRNA (cytosine(967)-C(5))-methyltransferase RsmB [Aliikangiella coralliicola]|uniref:16S rRNA (cytosine(967)-C(5))-methyltransferase RsmB n=1 Tax=Aliikangiella coralliicola TaxID=2592383 RepID=UPI00143CDDCD|nr:16S rRNA (cytosine(967)-C(5))-methyltransferase RsmB [Aliikangiella coralliicola]
MKTVRFWEVVADPRLVALGWLIRVHEGRSVNDLLANSSQSPGSDRHPANQLSPQQKAQAKQILYGCLRYYHQLKTIAENLLAKPFKDKDLDLLLVVVTGLYQLKYLSTPDHAAISESVELTRKLKKKWASGVINGVLRRYQREKDEIEDSLSKSLQFQFSHPGWIIKKLRQDWPSRAEDILSQNNQHAPMILRVNTQVISQKDYLSQLTENNYQASPHPVAADAVVLEKASDVFSLPLFQSGGVTVQDAAPQLAVELLQLDENLRALDACAAPGGKTGHIMQRQPNLELTAVELSPRRAQKIQETLERLYPAQSCHLICADVTEVEDWWDGQLYDRILLDVPCSASGVIRRNPDIKIHRKTTDIQPLVEIQSKILDKTWELLKPGGILVYATCSVFKQENDAQIAAFTKRNEVEFVSLPNKIEKKLNNEAEFGYQIFPGEAQMDGFYLCGLKKPG